MKKMITLGLAIAVLSAATPAVAEAETDGGGWSAPRCGSVTGDGSVTFTRNEGRTVAPTSQALRPVVYTTGLVALDKPGALLALSNNVLLSSGDAGCTWTPVSKVSGWFLGLAAARGGRAYAWDRDGNLTLATPASATPLTSPAADLAGLGTDQGDGDHLRVSGGDGQLYDSGDGGHSWKPIGVPGVPAGPLTYIYKAAFDPSDVDHVVLGGMQTGARVTFDGGRTWIASTGLGKGDNVNVFSVVISPAAPNVVYAMGLNMAESNAGVPSEGRHIYKSVDGGRHFTPVVDHGNGVTLPNGPEMAADPTDPGVVYFVFGTSFQAYGTDIYRYDSSQRKVTVAHNSYDRVTAIAFHPTMPRLMYLGAAEER
ncbi:WD40/YVTN/BNR-like repeat-containing protein [Actinomadura alba]|uniref:Dispase autolysis-inducing protein n=1 Tax=Actinomadura alba TaxID=406431 RepID=A0ABR7M0P1_9ACTN|nr:dispase autolysis-inducing protein [Actinomadura alba]MBC6470493.1 dispase autolysis-inducing protein [Actinomadura alba]